MRHPLHELLSRLLDAGRLAPGRDNQDPERIDSRDEIERAFDSRDARGA